MDYQLVRTIHVTAVASSYALFVLRGVWMMRAPGLLAKRWVKVVPHVVDTVLLASAVLLAAALHQYPLGVDWLTAKVAGLIVYIALGTIALKRGRTRRTRVAAWIAAQGVFLYIVLVALTKNPRVLF